MALDHTAFPAIGTHEAILTVPDFGRYAITVTSGQGTALQLVDRMAGPGDVQGVPGQSDGRIDAFLERGSYKIRLISDAHGGGTAKLAVSAFTELQAAPVALAENNPATAGLGDDQQRSWFVSIPVRGTYSFEAGGRYLTDLRLWDTGGWMVNAAPVTAESDAVPEKPLALRQLVAQLEPGLYRLTAYGGAGLPWAKTSTDAPFMLRWGIPKLSDSGRSLHLESPLGIDRFLVPGTVTVLNLVIDHPDQADISAQPYNVASMFNAGQASDAAISKTSRDPVASLPLSAQDTKVPWLVTVTYRPGASYRLEALNAAGTQTVTGTGGTLLAVTLAGNPDDEIDPGFLLVDDQQRAVEASAIDLDTALPWRRHFDLLGPVQTFLHTGRSIDLRIDGSGVPAQFVVARLMTNAPPDEVVPPPKPSGGVWTLTPGYYTLTAIPAPNGRGILTMSLYEKGAAAPAADSSRRAAALFPDIRLDPAHPETLFTSLPDGAAYGLRQVALPARLAQPLSLELAAGAAAAFPIVAPEAELVSVADEAGAKVAFKLDGLPQPGNAVVAAGRHQFQLTGPGPGDSVITIAATPQRLLAPPPVPIAQTIPSEPRALLPDQPMAVNLDRSQTASFALPVGQDALYQFQTTGLLETAGTIRTRTNPALASAEGNGIGRNFLLQPFLRQGDYQLSVQAQGQTTGHAGVVVTETPVLDAGVLADGLPARLTLEPGQAALYRFHIAAAGSYHIFTLGLGHPFTMRLEDASAWPLIAPGGAADATMDLAPGDYRYLLLPGTVENRAVTMLQRILPPVINQGHGPFPAVFGQDMDNRWMEPAPGQPRNPDVWTMSLPAAAMVTVTIDGGMTARIFGPGAAKPLAVTSGSWTGKLPAGAYRIEAVSAAPDSRIDYTLRITSAELLAGQSRDITAPVKLPVSLGGGQQYEISSFGGQDVKASLYDAAGRLVAANDDRDNDWNFLIAGSFPAGLYTLDVDPVGADSAATNVSVAVPAVTADPALQAGVPAQFSDGQVHLLPLPAVAAGALLLAGATAEVPVGLTLEVQDAGGGWRGLATTGGLNPYIAVPAGAGRYRLRAWAEDHGATPVAVTALGVSPAAENTAALADGLDLLPVNLGGRQLGVAAVAVDHAAIFTLSEGTDTLRWSDAADAPLQRDPAGTILAAGTMLWFADAAPGQVAARPVDLSSAPATFGLGAALALPAPAADGGALWQASALGAQPGISVDDGDGAVPVMAVPAAAGTLMQAVAFQPSGMDNPVVHLWQAGAPAPALKITLRRTGFAPPADFSLQTGDNGGMIGGRTALAAALAPGWKRFTLNLPAGMAAVFAGGGKVQTLVAANGGAPDLLESDADTMTLLNPAADPAPYSVNLQAVSQPALLIAPGGLLTQYSATPAVLHLAVTGAAPLRIAGSATAVSTFGGQALVTMQPGLAVVSEAGPQTANAAAQPAAAPGVVALTGARMLLEVPAGPARLVNVQTDTPVLLRDRATGIPTLFAEGAAANLFQPKGQPLDLDIAATGGQNLSGSAWLATATAIPITDGLGPKYLAGPGQSLLFTFSLTAPRGIGVGVRGTVDDAQCRLLASDGTVLGSGAVFMNQLPPGTYFLAVDVPAGAAATIIQPALVGMTLPDDGPPPDVVASYAALPQ